MCVAKLILGFVVLTITTFNAKMYVAHLFVASSECVSRKTSREPLSMLSLYFCARCHPSHEF